VVAGTVEIARAGAAVDTVGAGGFVGEISLIDAGPRTATVTTLTPCELLRVDNRHFDALIESSPAIRERLQEAMEARLEQMDAAAEVEAP
jgi:CRP/FNR family transcriptional regulator, cyclic AMP receptor protein